MQSLWNGMTSLKHQMAVGMQVAATQVKQKMHERKQSTANLDRDSPDGDGEGDDQEDKQDELYEFPKPVKKKTNNKRDRRDSSDDQEGRSSEDNDEEDDDDDDDDEEGNDEYDFDIIDQKDKEELH